MQIGSSFRDMKSSIKARKITLTEPVAYVQEDENETVLKAKHYLINIDEDQSYVSFKRSSKHKNADLLAEWNSTHNQNIRMTQRLKNLQAEVKRSRLASSFDQQNQLNFSLVEKQLISKQGPKSSIVREKTNATTYVKNRRIKQIQHLSASKHQKEPILQYSLPKPSLKSVYVKRVKLGQKQFPTKVDISSLIQLNSSVVVSYRYKDKQFSEKLPRLDNMQTQMFKNKYNSVFRNINIRSQKFSISPSSLLSKQIIKINDLIKEENVKFTNKL